MSKQVQAIDITFLECPVQINKARGEVVVSTVKLVPPNADVVWPSDSNGFTEAGRQLVADIKSACDKYIGSQPPV